MTEAQKVSAIKRINERLADIRRGVDRGEIPRSYYERFRDAIDLNIPAEYRTRSGNISHGSKAVQNIPDSVIEALESRQTRGEIRESAKDHIMEENPFDYTTPDDIPDYVIDEYLDDADFVNTELSEHYNATYDILDLKYRGTEGKKSYRELRQTIEEGIMLGEAEVKSRLEERDILGVFFE